MYHLYPYVGTSPFGLDTVALSGYTVTLAASVPEPPNCVERFDAFSRQRQAVPGQASSWRYHGACMLYRGLWGSSLEWSLLAAGTAFTAWLGALMVQPFIHTPLVVRYLWAMYEVPSLIPFSSSFSFGCCCCILGSRLAAPGCSAPRPFSTLGALPPATQSFLSLWFILTPFPSLARLLRRAPGFRSRVGRA